MKAEAVVLGIIVLASIYYLKRVEEITLSTQTMFQSSVEMVQVHETRLAHVEEAVEEVPGMRRELREIKDILLARGN